VDNRGGNRVVISEPSSISFPSGAIVNITAPRDVEMEMAQQSFINSVFGVNDCNKGNTSTNFIDDDVSPHRQSSSCSPPCNMNINERDDDVDEHERGYGAFNASVDSNANRVIFNVLQAVSVEPSLCYEESDVSVLPSIFIFIVFMFVV
jgi:hypothetical protein